MDPLFIFLELLLELLGFFFQGAIGQRLLAKIPDAEDEWGPLARAFYWACSGGFFGWVALRVLFRGYYVHSPTLRIINAIVAPILLGLATRAATRRISLYSTFKPGFLGGFFFGLGFSLARLWLISR